MKLFDRIGRRIEITEAGRLLQREATKILEQVELTERGLHELNDLQSGQLKLGASLTIGNYWIPEKISNFQRQYPRIQVSCILSNTTEICAGIVRGQFDLGFVEGEIEPKIGEVLELAEVGSDQLIIVVGRSHPWAKVPWISGAELSTTAWILREPGSGTRAKFEQALRTWGIDPDELHVLLTMTSGEMVKAVVESGIGATAISELMVKKELQLSSLHRVEVRHSDNIYLTQMSRSFLQLRHRQRFQTRIAQVFVQQLVNPSCYPLVIGGDRN